MENIRNWWIIIIINSKTENLRMLCLYFLMEKNQPDFSVSKNLEWIFFWNILCNYGNRWDQGKSFHHNYFIHLISCQCVSHLIQELPFITLLIEFNRGHFPFPQLPWASSVSTDHIISPNRLLSFTYCAWK